MKKGQEIIPEEQYRLKNEDLFTAVAGGNPQDFGMKGGSGSGKSSTSTKISDDDLPDSKLNGKSFREASQTLYARKGDKSVGL